MVVRSYYKISIFFLSLLLCSDAVNKTGSPFYLGALLSRVDNQGKIFGLGTEMLAAFLLAVKEINNSTTLLPNTPIKISVRDSKLDSNQAVTETLYLAATAFGDKGVSATIGPISSSEATSSAVVAQAFEQTQISPAASSPFLSYRKPNFGYFSRTVPSDSYQGQAVADLLLAYDWRKVCVVVSNDNYGNGLYSAFSNRVNKYKDFTITAFNTGPGQSSYQPLLDSFNGQFCRIWVLFMLTVDAGVLIENGYNSGVFVEGTQIIGSDGVIDPSLWQNISYANVPKVMKGLLGFVPSFPITEPLGLAFIDNYINQAPTNGDPVTGKCNTAKDDDGNYLYQVPIAADINNLPGNTTYQCIGVDFSVFASDGSNFQPYTAYAYDAVYAAAYAAHAMIYGKKLSVPASWTKLGVNQLYYDTLMGVNFQGATGLVKFSPPNSTDGSNFPEGDRLTGIFYTLFNFQPAVFNADPTGRSGLVRSGFWTPKLGVQICDYYDNGAVPISGCQIVFNTNDNSVPIDGPPSITLNTPSLVRSVLFPLALLAFASTVAVFLLFIYIWRRAFWSKLKRETLLILLIGCLFAGARVLIPSFDISSLNCSLIDWFGHLAIWCIGTTLVMKVSYQQKSLLQQLGLRFGGGSRRMGQGIKSAYLEFDPILSQKFEDTSFKLASDENLPSDGGNLSSSVAVTPVTNNGAETSKVSPTSNTNHEPGIEMNSNKSASTKNHVIDMVSTMMPFSPSPRLSALVASNNKRSPQGTEVKYSVIPPSEKNESHAGPPSMTPSEAAEGSSLISPYQPLPATRQLATSVDATYCATPVHELKPTLVSRRINSLESPSDNSYSPPSFLQKGHLQPLVMSSQVVNSRTLSVTALLVFVIGYLFVIQFVSIPLVIYASSFSGPQQYLQMECGFNIPGFNIVLTSIEYAALILGTMYCRWTKYHRVTYKLEQKIIFRCLVLLIILFTIIIAFDKIATSYSNIELASGTAYFLLAMLSLMTVAYLAVTRSLTLEKLPVHRAIADDESPQAVKTLIEEFPMTLGQRDLDNLTAFDWAVAAFEQEYARKYPHHHDADAHLRDHSLHAVATTLDWWPILNSIVLHTLPVNSNDPDLGPVPADVHCYLWTRLVQSDRNAQIIEHLLDDNAESRLPEKLAAATDENGRKAVDLASPLCKRVLLESMYFLKRYELTTNERAHYQSRTSIILFAIDHWDNQRPVALKMMRHVEQLEKEVKTRQQAHFNDTYVVNVSRYYSADHDNLYLIALKKWNLTDYPYCIVMPKGERDVGEILAKENIDLDSIRVVARQIALCLQHIHQIGYVHGDIKRKLKILERFHFHRLKEDLCLLMFVIIINTINFIVATNILRVNGRELKLIDLDGCTRYISDGRKSTALVGVLGNGPIKFSSGYMPPEYIQNHIADLKQLKKRLKDQRYLWKRKKEKEKSAEEAKNASEKPKVTEQSGSDKPNNAPTRRAGSIFLSRPKNSSRHLSDDSNTEVLSDGETNGGGGNRWRKFRNSITAFTRTTRKDSTKVSDIKPDLESDTNDSQAASKELTIGIDSAELGASSSINPSQLTAEAALTTERESNLSNAESKEAESKESKPELASSLEWIDSSQQPPIWAAESKEEDPTASIALRRGSRGSNRDALCASRESRESRESRRGSKSSSQDDESMAPQRLRMLRTSSINNITGIIPTRVPSTSTRVSSFRVKDKDTPRFGYSTSEAVGDDDDDDDIDEALLDDKNDEFMSNVNKSETFNATVVSPTQDMWSYGVVLYNLVVNAPLFLEDNDGNVIQKTDLEALLEWKDDVKVAKLSAVKDLYARNLISLLLTKDPNKRLTMEKVLAHPFLNPGMRPTRLEGDPPEYDVFISYRVLSDSDLAEALYNELTSRGLSVFWDKMCLQDGELWEDGFCRGIVKSRIFLPIFSKDAMRNQSLPRLNWENLEPNSAVDNVLLEHRLAIEMMSRGLLEKIYPVFAGPRKSPATSPTENGKSSIIFNKYNFSETMDGESCYPACPDTVVKSIEAKFADHLDRQGLGLTLSGERLTVKTIVSKISQYQGKALEGPIDVEVKKVVDSVYSMCTVQTLPFTRPTLGALSSFSSTSFSNYATPMGIDGLTRKEAFKTILDNFASYLESLNTPPEVIAVMRDRHERLYDSEDPSTFLSHFSSMYGINLADSIPGLGSSSNDESPRAQFFGT